MAENGYAKPVLVTTDWLAGHLHDENLVVAEVDEDPALYDEGHITGAVKLHWREDLQDPVERDLVEKDDFEQLLQERGIANDSTVVLYGDRNNWFAAYAYWYLKIYGHGDVRILDGGRQKWIDDGRDLTTEVPSPSSTGYTATDRDESIRAYRGYVREIIDDSGNALVDVRSPQEYSGELIAPPGYEQEGAQRAGHIPRAQSIPWAQAVRDDGTFKTADELKELYERQGRQRGQRSHGLLPDRRAQRPYLVRPQRTARLQERPKLRRLVDRVGQPSRRPNRKEHLKGLLGNPNHSPPEPG